jgi:biopolymer transport protein ExbB
MTDILIRQFTSIGAPIMVALIVVSVVGVAVAIQKLASLRRLGVGRHRAARMALSQWAAGDAIGAYQTISSDRSALSRVIAQTMAARRQWPQDKERAREVGTGTAMSLLEDMGRNVRILDTAVQAAPMLGLLGTVLGMIVSFNEMSVGGSAIDPAQLAGGIWIALSATALGLAIAIPFYFLTSWIDGRIERERAAMDTAIVSVIFGPGPEFGYPQPSVTHPPRHTVAEQKGFDPTRPRW